MDPNVAGDTWGAGGDLHTELDCGQGLRGVHHPGMVRTPNRSHANSPRAGGLRTV